MSMTGSLMGYENNNDVGQAAKKKGLKPLPVATCVNAAGVTTAVGNGGLGAGGSRSSRNFKPITPRQPANHTSRKRRHLHVNSLWSVWYGIIAVAFQAYIAVRCTKRFIAFLSLPWPADAPPPKLELHACLALLGAGVLLLPILLAAAFVKLGNLANDGVKLGRHTSSCSRDPPTLPTPNSDTSLGQNLWRHGGPTSALIHLCTAMCFLLPSLLMEARLIHAGFLPKDAIWRTDLDWVMVHRDRLVVLSFMNIPENLTMGLTGSQPSYTSPPYLDDELEELANSSESWTSPQTTRLVPVSSSAAATLASTEPDVTSDQSSYAKVSDNPSSPASASRRPTSRMNARNVQRGRPKAKKNSAVARQRPTAQQQQPRGNWTAQSLPLSLNSLADLDTPERFSQEIDETSEEYGPITLEYLNYAMALGVYSVRYPAVFWATNKALGTIFSIQLVANSAQSLLAYAGMSVLYKVQVVGPLKVLPLLRHRTVTTASTISNFLGERFFLLNPHVTLGLFCLASLLVLCSSMVTYLYAYGRFAAFLRQERERRIILSKEIKASEQASWAYMTQPAAVCVFLAISICSAPLVYDYSVVYRGSLDGAVLACLCSTLLHLVLWLLLWICLSLKRRWCFKLRVTIARASVRSARSLKLVTDLDLASRDDEDTTATPLLVVGNGRTYTVADTSPKKAIMSVIQKAAMERKARSQGTTLEPVEGDADGDEQIYWLRPKLRPSPVQSGNPGASGAAGQANDRGWLNKKLKQKVTFNDLPSTSGARNKGKARRGPEDDGDYATLRELPLVTAHELTDDTTSEENKHWGRWLSPRRDIPKFTDVENGGTPQTPRCLRRADSGMPHEELTPRSDSSHSPPLDGSGVGCLASTSTSSNSETSSSGVHSVASNASSQRRATSVEELTNEPREEPHWRSCSLQRGTQPPTAKCPTGNPGRVIANPGANYAAASPYQPGQYNGELPALVSALEPEATVVIRRKSARPKLQEQPSLGEEPFGRSTNMRMTSFTEGTELRPGQPSSATLPHYPTQPLVTYPHCSTMPLPHASGPAAAMAGPSASCGSVPSHPGQIQPGQQQLVPLVHGTVPSHTTLPTHNGIRLMMHPSNPSSPNPFVKRFPAVHQPWPVLPGGPLHHHTFPQMPTMNGKLVAPQGQQLHQSRLQSDRDSANFSMASSGDSDTCLPH